MANPLRPFLMRLRLLLVKSPALTTAPLVPVLQLHWAFPCSSNITYFMPPCSNWYYCLWYHFCLFLTWQISIRPLKFCLRMTSFVKSILIPLGHVHCFHFHDFHVLFMFFFRYHFVCSCYYSVHVSPVLNCNSIKVVERVSYSSQYTQC